MAKVISRSILDGECITIFRAAVKSKYTLDPYERRLIAFLGDVGKTCDEFVELAKTDPSVVEKMIIDFILHEKQSAAKQYCYFHYYKQAQANKTSVRNE